jgi:serine/threonine protein kinase
MNNIPSVLGQRYEFEYDIGQWTFGSIAIVKQKHDKELRTCKTVPKCMVNSAPDVIRRLRGLQELQHPHIINVTEVQEDKANYYIITEFMQGGEISDWVERLMDGYVVQEQTVAAYIRQLIGATMHSSSANIFHGALLPSSLWLSSKMPDAIVKVADFGLASILDPENTIAQRNRSPYTAPEIVTGEQGYVDNSSDMYSIGAIAHALLIGRAPGGFRSKEQMFSSCFATAGSGIDGQLWAERSPTSRDFVFQLLAHWEDRLSAARALQHSWVKGVQPAGLATTEKSNSQEIQQKTLCYMLAVLMVPNLLPYRDFEQLQSNFNQNDSDGDGLAPLHIVQRILRGRCALKEAVDAAIKISDVHKSEILDLCSTACADLIAREFFAAGPTGQPLMGPFKASDLAPRMLKRFFEVFGGRQPSVTLSSIRSKLRTATALEVEQVAGVQYEEVLAGFPDQGPIDSQMLSSLLIANGGRGTPLCGEYVQPCTDIEPLGAFKDIKVSVNNFLRGCGLPDVSFAGFSFGEIR